MSLAVGLSRMAVTTCDFMVHGLNRNAANRFLRGLEDAQEVGIPAQHVQVPVLIASR